MLPGRSGRSLGERAANSGVRPDGPLRGGPVPTADDPGTGRMNAGSFRALCWRVVAPASTVDSATQTIQLTVTAFAP